MNMKNNQEMERIYFFEGEVRGEDSSWKPDKSLFILGISRENA